MRGDGYELIDTNGVLYVDMVAGIAVCALGHAHPAITKAIAKQAVRVVTTRTLFYHEPAGMLANKLAERSGLERVFFSNSGAEANEAAIKLASNLKYRKGEDTTLHDHLVYGIVSPPHDGCARCNVQREIS